MGILATPSGLLYVGIDVLFLKREATCHNTYDASNTSHYLSPLMEFTGTLSSPYSNFNFFSANEIVINFKISL